MHSILRKLLLLACRGLAHTREAIHVLNVTCGDADLAAERGRCGVLHDMVQDAQAAVQRVPLPQGSSLCRGQGKGAPIEIAIGAVRAALPQARCCT